MKPRIQNLIAGTVLLCCVAFAVGGSHAVGSDEGQKEVAAPGQQAAKLPMVNLTEREADQALKFAAKHHPELADLLQQLRQGSPSGFSRGIREVHIAIQRLERFKEKQPARFDAELASWKSDSEIRLLTAKWLMSQDPELETQIRDLLRLRQQTKIDRLKSERDRLAERLLQLDNQIGMGTTELEADLVDEWSRLAKRAATTAKTQKSRQSNRKNNGTKTPRLEAVLP